MVPNVVRYRTVLDSQPTIRPKEATLFLSRGVVAAASAESKSVLVSPVKHQISRNQLYLASRQPVREPAQNRDLQRRQFLVSADSDHGRVETRLDKITSC